MHTDIYINNKVNRSTAVMGILSNKGFIKDRRSMKESNEAIELRKKCKSQGDIDGCEATKSIID